MTAAPELSERVAGRLYAHGDHAVRTLEAVAAAEANRVRRTRELPEADPPPTGDRLAAMCRRIARRALATRRADGIDGATAYHEAGESPAWARAERPVAQVGEMLFYDPAGSAGGETGSQHS
ncbi:Cell Wall Hydrolase [Limimonas halophila]|uniref:Cell Wall Hydrolase n=1 Tax=Limimonas halophila TaxID=1082479 RepID=A0A1G7UZS3_9PROT|nr:cell wall hydrolase [Limimonas halophila]SDG53072.1 Cell Wall Hydrolase [Limimonas halophila]